MNKVLICLVFAFSVSSCIMKEKMIMNEDGSGNFSYGFDMSPMFKLGMKKTDSTQINKIVDTSFTFKEVFTKIKDSISKLPGTDKDKIEKLEKETEIFKILENFKVSLKINEEKKEFEYNMMFDFPSVVGSQKLATPAESLEALAVADKKRLGAFSSIPRSEEKTSTTIFYDGKVFIKTVTPSKEDKKVKKKEAKKEKSDDPFSKKMDEMLKECKYIAEYQFPKKIKNVSIKNALIAPDRRSFTVEIPLDNMQESNVDFGFKVEFEQ